MKFAIPVYTSFKVSIFYGIISKILIYISASKAMSFNIVCQIGNGLQFPDGKTETQLCVIWWRSLLELSFEVWSSASLFFLLIM